MTRIIGGLLKGQQLRVPPKGTRPTSDRVREAMFSRLEHLDAIRDARVLDLYAGSGALGIEALSRGAKQATFVEAHAGAAKVCSGNLSSVGVHGQVHVSTVKKFLLTTPNQSFHTVLADPPYDLEEGTEILGILLRGWLAPEAVLMWEQPSKHPPLTWPEPLRDLGEKTYGETRLNFAEFPG